MRPLAQTFLVTEPSAGVEGVFLTSVDLFFRGIPVGITQGVEIQIRETLNGVPLSKIIPYGSAIVSGSTIVASDNSTVATTFTFSTPVLLRTNEPYAIAILPLGGESQYRLWTAQRENIDVVTGNQIVFPSNIGNLYAPSNDLTSTVIQNQALKFRLNLAQFTATSGVARFNRIPSEFFKTRPPTGSFIENERVVLGNNNIALAQLVVTPTLPFANGEVVVQPNTATSNATSSARGVVYFSNSTVTLLRDTIGKFTTVGGGLNGLTTSNKSGNPSAAFTNVATISACTVITVPATSTIGNDFSNGSYLYISRPELNEVNIARVVSVNDNTRQITLDRPVSFTSVDALIGRVRADGSLYGLFAYNNELRGDNIISLYSSNANTTQNFTNSAGTLLIGESSRAAAAVDGLVNIYYDSITSQIPVINTKDTETVFRFTGYGNNATVDSSAISIFQDIPEEFVDRQRMIFSRSNEITTLGSNSSVTVTAELSTRNTRFSPYIDLIKNNIIVTSNQIRPENRLEGFHLQIDNANGLFTKDMVVWQSNATSNTSGIVYYANTSLVSVFDVVTTNTAQYATFTANSTSLLISTTGVQANLVNAVLFNESIGNGSTLPSRYISKTVVLADQQDAEDMILFLTAYRPQGTNIKVYSKLLNAADSDPFDEKSWTPMIDTTPSLFSSLGNRDDYVELRFELPSSVQIHPSGISVNTTSTFINFTGTRTTQGITPGSFVYVADATNQTFSVRRVLEVPNTSTLVTRSNLTFNSSNASVGIIRGSQAQCNAFRYTINNGIVRYVCNTTDSIFDGYKSFAIKLVLVSDNTQIVPRIADMRTLALQI